MSDTDALRILMVDDKPMLLSGYRRTVGRVFDVRHALATVAVAAIPAERFSHDDLARHSGLSGTGPAGS